MSPTTITTRRYRSLLDPLLIEPIIQGMTDGWELRNNYKITHNNALTGPRENEVGIVGLLRGWLVYADSYESQFRIQTDPDKCWHNRECDDCNGTWDYRSQTATTDGFFKRYEEFEAVCQECRNCNSGLIGDDYVLGAAWEEIGTQILNLLNGDLGRLDGGTLDEVIHEALKLAGLTETSDAPNAP